MNKSCITAAFTTGILCLIANAATAQTDSDYLLESRNRNTRVDVAIGLGPKVNHNSVSWVKLANLDAKRTFHVGGGLRLFNLNYNGLIMTAQGSNQSGFYSFPSSGRVLGLNLVVATEFTFLEKYGIGANLDLLGTSLGSVLPSDGQTDFTYHKEGSPGITPGEIGGETSGFNSCFPGKSMGTYCSEVFGMYKAGKKTWIKLSYSRIATDVTLSHPQDKFVGKGNMLVAGLRFQY